MNTEPDSTPPVPEVQIAGQRTLAAIVFTDTVGFSALMSKNEEHTLRLVARDMDVMKAHCESFGGQVLKSTGDGLLMLFTSAVQAVACSLEIQREFFKRNLEVARTDVLQHRIGIHLGDIFQHGGDVLGDGVNIAARLQTQAVPGGICLSNTVYDVVHNRLQFYVNDLGARKLKNIGMVTAYQISPLESQPAGFRIGWYRWKPWIWRGAGLLLVFLIAGFTYYLGADHWLKHRHKTAQNQNPSPSATNSAAATVTVPVANVPPVPSEPPLTEVSQTEFDTAQFKYMKTYDFDGMQMWASTHTWPGKNATQLDLECQQMSHLFNWSYAQLAKYTMAKPLLAVNNKGKTVAYWPAPFDGINVKFDNQMHALSRSQMGPFAMEMIINALIKENSPPNDPKTKQLREELRFFVSGYQVHVITHAAANPAPAQ